MYIHTHTGKIGIFQDLFLDQYARLPIGDVLVKIHMENKHAMFILMNSIILSLKPGLQYQLTKN